MTPPTLGLCLQVGSLLQPRGLNSNTSEVLLNRSAPEQPPCDGVPYALLCCVTGMLTSALFLRVSSVPKMALLLLVAGLYVTVLEVGGLDGPMG